MQTLPFAKSARQTQRKYEPTLGNGYRGRVGKGVEKIDYDDKWEK